MISFSQSSTEKVHLFLLLANAMSGHSLQYFLIFMFCKSISTEARETDGSSVFIQNKYSPSSSLHIKMNYRKVYQSTAKQECVLEEA